MPPLKKQYCDSHAELIHGLYGNESTKQEGDINEHKRRIIDLEKRADKDDLRYWFAYGGVCMFNVLVGWYMVYHSMTLK